MQQNSHIFKTTSLGRHGPVKHWYTYPNIFIASITCYNEKKWNKYMHIIISILLAFLGRENSKVSHVCTTLPVKLV